MWRIMKRFPHSHAFQLPAGAGLDPTSRTHITLTNELIKQQLSVTCFFYYSRLSSNINHIAIALRWWAYIRDGVRVRYACQIVCLLPHTHLSRGTSSWEIYFLWLYVIILSNAFVEKIYNVYTMSV